MNHESLIRAGALYFPIVLALLLGLLRGRQPRQFAGCLLSVLWSAPALLILEQFDLRAGWWHYSPNDIAFGGMPLELYLGWIVLWGILPQLLFRKVPVVWCTAVFVAVDLILMPACNPVVRLGDRWLTGEAVAVLIVLIPAICIGRWTYDDSHLRLRAGMQIVIAGMLFLYLLPEIAFALRPGKGWAPLWDPPGWQLQIALQVLVLLAIPGVSAVMEFADRGIGTPIPYDPPKRLVTSGIYRYCSNPMQASCAAVMLAWSVLLHNRWLVLAATISLIYSAGIAEWDERQDLRNRFGAEWTTYRKEVKNWRFRWRPYCSGPNPRLYIAASCGQCSELRTWLAARTPLGIEIIDAETLPPGSIRRLRYDPADGSASVDGIRALGRALEHLHLGWALAGAAMRLPFVWQSIQVVMDASGFGPRTLPDSSSTRVVPSPR